MKIHKIYVNKMSIMNKVVAVKTAVCHNTLSFAACFDMNKSHSFHKNKMHLLFQIDGDLDCSFDTDHFQIKNLVMMRSKQTVIFTYSFCLSVAE